MSAIHEVATLTSGGQITLPKAIRQALGVGVGGKIAFDLRGDKVVVSRSDAGDEVPAFLSLLARDLETGLNIHSLPGNLARAMLEHASPKVVLDEDFDEDVEI